MQINGLDIDIRVGHNEYWPGGILDVSNFANGWGICAKAHIYSQDDNHVIQIRKKDNTVALFNFYHSEAIDSIPDWWKDSEIIWQMRTPPTPREEDAEPRPKQP